MKISFHSFNHPDYSGFIDTKLVIDGEPVDESWCETINLGGDLYVDIPAQILRQYKSVHWSLNAYPGGKRDWHGSGASAIKKLIAVRYATLPSAWNRLPGAGDALAYPSFYSRLTASKGPKLNLMLDKYRNVLLRESAARDALTAALLHHRANLRDEQRRNAAH